MYVSIINETRSQGERGSRLREKTMSRTILISGASGLIGSALVAHLRSHDNNVIRLVRDPSVNHADTIYYSYTSELAEEKIDQERFDCADVIIHLAGAPITGSLWTKSYKQTLYESRIQSTRHIARIIKRASSKPRLFIVASAVGIYGDRGDELLDERSSEGEGFLAHLCKDWEKEAYITQSDHTRVVTARIGLVLSHRGGFLGRMLPLFKLGLGGHMGDGLQYMSWIALPDIVRAFEHIIVNENLRGAINLVGAHPVTNRKFTIELASVLKRSAFITQPAWLLNLLPGEMAQEMLLSSTRVLPKRLDESGFLFEYKNLNDVLMYALNMKEKN